MSKVQVEVVYPEKPPTEAGVEFVRIVRNNQMATRRQELALYGWVVAGYLLRQWPGSPDEIPIFGADQPSAEKMSASEEECLCAIEAAVSATDMEGNFHAKALPLPVTLLLNYLLKILLDKITK